MIAVIVGTRPQFIKSALLSVALRSAGLSHIVINTGQHFDWHMSGSIIRGLPQSAPMLSLASSNGPSGAYLEARRIGARNC